jgi:hypothetical protein
VEDSCEHCTFRFHKMSRNFYVPERLETSQQGPSSIDLVSQIVEDYCLLGCDVKYCGLQEDGCITSLRKFHKDITLIEFGFYTEALSLFEIKSLKINCT